MPQTADQSWMRVALDLAIAGQGHVEPNPMVGCVLVRNGVAIARGFHARYGGPHAEAAALARCPGPGGSTAYVTLEPCCHHGKTPPCADALIAAGVARVVVGSVDPSAKVAGRGIERLRQAGIAVDVGVLAEECNRLIAPFAKHSTTGLPWIIAKWAMTADGRIATAAGHSRWITGPAARADVHRVRGLVDVVGVGLGTAIADNPELTVRVAGRDEPPRRPVRAVFCRTRLPALDSRLVQTAKDTPLVIVQGPPPPDQPPMIADPAWQQLPGVHWLNFSDHSPGDWLRAAMVEFGRGVAGRPPATNVVIEGGGMLFGQFHAAGLIDEAHIYVGAKLIGGRGAAGPIGDPGVATMSAATVLELLDVERFDGDVKLTYRRSPPAVRRAFSPSDLMVCESELSGQ